jgi:hypothetical protein
MTLHRHDVSYSNASHRLHIDGNTNGADDAKHCYSILCCYQECHQSKKVSTNYTRVAVAMSFTCAYDTYTSIYFTQQKLLV